MIAVSQGSEWLLMQHPRVNTYIDSLAVPSKVKGIEWGSSRSHAASAIVLDVTRLVAHRWSGKLATGIDRVGYAYLAHYRNISRAVVQFQGVRSIFTARHSQALFDLLLNPGPDFRGKVLMLAARALPMGRSKPPCHGAFYINVAHTDIDRADFPTWLQACGLNAVLMIHDLIPITHAEYCTPHATIRHSKRVDNALNHALGIIANSESTAHDIRKYAKERGRNVPSIMPLWLAGTYFDCIDAGISKPDSYFVYASTLEGRKNHFMLLKIWRQFVERMGDAAPHLVIIGQSGAESAHVQNMLRQCRIIHPRVTVLSDCSDAELGDWMSKARAVLFPSFAEGFGLPLVEALALGTPVIASDILTFREIGQQIPTLIDPLDARGWADMILAFMEDCPERERQLSLMSGFRAPTWGAHLDGVDTWLEALRPGFGLATAPLHNAAVANEPALLRGWSAGVDHAHASTAQGIEAEFS